MTSNRPSRPHRPGRPSLDILGPDDLPAIATIERLVFPEPLSLAEVIRLWASLSTVYVGIHDEGRLAAYFGFEIHGPTAHVVANATHPDFRRRGYASRVLREAEAIARSRGARWFVGEVRRSNTPQRRVLARLGWQEIGICPAFFGNGEDGYVVWHLLPDPQSNEGD